MSIPKNSTRFSASSVREQMSLLMLLVCLAILIRQSISRELTRYAVVESGARKKKSRGGLNIFQFAQTVEHDAWEDEQRRQALQVHRECLGMWIMFICDSSRKKYLVLQAKIRKRTTLNPLHLQLLPQTPSHLPRPSPANKKMIRAATTPLSNIKMIPNPKNRSVEFQQARTHIVLLVFVFIQLPTLCCVSKT